MAIDRLDAKIKKKNSLSLLSVKALQIQGGRPITIVFLYEKLLFALKKTHTFFPE